MPPAAHAATPGTIAGTFSANGAPLEGVWVNAYSDETDTYGDASTDASGHYSMTGLQPGRYTVLFQSPGRPAQYAYGKVSSDVADLITVTSGATTTVDDSALPAGTISGVLTDSHGSPVPNAQVSASSPSGGYGFGMTQYDGSYAIAVLPGTYTVSFRIGSVEQFAHGKSYQDADVFEVNANATTTVNETLQPVGSITGHVTRSDGTPAVDVEVTALQATGNSAGYAMTDDSGNYRLDYLIPGSYRVQFTLQSGAAQLAHDQRSEATAASFTVTGGGVVTVDESLLPTGSIAGRLTNQAGAGIADVYVSLSSTMTNEYLSTQTDGSGNYAIDEVFAGSGYKVHFYSPDQHIDQWATGKRTVETATAFTVTGGNTTTVNDKKPASGSVKITAKDSITGAAISSFNAYLGESGAINGSSTNGSLIFSDVAAGAWDLSVSATGYVFQTVPVTVTAGQQTAVTVTMRPTAKIKVKVVDRATGAGLKDFVVLALSPKDFAMPEGIDGRTAADGTKTVEVNNGGPYHLFVFPKTGSGYGAQWVGPNGGTGSELLASTFSATNGQTITPPTILMDKAGTITGKVTSETGNPIKYGGVTMAPQAYHSGGGFGQVDVAADGTYTIDFLGPYTWPLLFTAQDHAFQWSDGTGYRYGAPAALPRRTTSQTVTGPTSVTSVLPRRAPVANGVPVQSGQTTTFNYTMKAGVVVKVFGVADDFVDAYNVTTGDFQASGWIQDPAQGASLRMLPGTTVKFQRTRDWKWCGGATFATAKAYRVTTSPTQTFTCVVS
ncbi:hypothetical protein HDA40_004688 [Hamadaea flava]|uniref:alpha-amylase n=1 Tax=Hamadaea flava TaxID=1742688 RepID=A0ABV8LFE5_9ACTN|nr:carboxypeptidase-like regulatory domain-containing protein [Hamadaea flava]MCP2326181.1 hypothetical protein [Hamadaea flava]